MRIVFDSGISIACDIPQVAAWLKETTREKEAVTFEEFFTIVSATNFQANAEIFLIAVLACNHLLKAYNSELTRLDEPRFTEAERATEQENNLSRKAALDALIRSNQLDPDVILAAQQPSLTGPRLIGARTLYQNNSLMPITIIIAKHTFHERTIAEAITPYTKTELGEIEAFLIHNHWQIKNLVSKIRALVSDLLERPELSTMLDVVDNDIAPAGIRASPK